jgi:NAD(P)-dependent dehydrogenase (short-subunit alcohol dehydrogenase family)
MEANLSVQSVKVVMRFSNKVVLVTGGASGIGAAAAALMGKQGAIVFISDINNALGVETAKTIGATYIHQDVSNEAGWVEIMKIIRDKHQRLDVLVNNAGMFRPATIEDTDLDLWQQTIDVNLTGTMLGCREAIKVMKDNPGGPKGSIVNISSITGFIGLASGAAYTATKGAVRLMSKSVAVHCARQYKNIRCNSVHPGAIDTPMNIAAFEASEDPEGMRVFFDGIQPMGRMGTSEEVAETIAFLASDEARFITGTEVLVDGGWLAASGPL